MQNKMMQVMINNACKYTNANSYSNESKCYKYSYSYIR